MDRSVKETKKQQKDKVPPPFEASITEKGRELMRSAEWRNKTEERDTLTDSHSLTGHSLWDLSMSI